MRLDKFLKISRLIKRRTVANKICDAQKITVNGKIAKPSTNVKINDIITINRGQNNICVKVVKILTVTDKQNASDTYEVV